MPDLTPGATVYGLDFPPTVFDQDRSPILNVSTTEFVDGTPEVAVTATAPTSGRMFVAIAAGVRNNAATSDQIIVTYEIREDSHEGAIHQAGGGAGFGVRSVGVGSEEFKYMGNFSLAEDLTPGRSYYFVVQHAVTGGSSCDISARSLLVFPVP